ncbi:protein COFACTOR ASSEMBLY OF COMPLEX C SUBUNIT B CCB3, chloroplastic [Magnolia sinica]|uniref:protein COFACTOR ASSEMBLY OF COMPLEX C SUBUNIT B CCB3, chloroplastic n=1 Tax=Magnolia sinica TaxID=86752 RepID=UPI00265A8FC4|nr:protein COFACTOR ASSEMBLY OF COMPLEX C SUBUNIT B CCB3, chloroplastic [Magnolia sinica]
MAFQYSPIFPATYNRLQTSQGLAPLVSRPGNSYLLKSSSPSFFQIFENGSGSTRRKLLSSSGIRSTSLFNVVVSRSIELTPPSASAFPQPGDVSRSLQSLASDLPEKTHTISEHLHRLVLADVDPATAKLAIGIVGPLLSALSFLFIVRIVMSWYPKLPVDKFPYVLAYAPTEPLLIPTRKVIPPLGGVDVTPVVWFGLVSFLNEILVGPQGLLVLLSQQV